MWRENTPSCWAGYWTGECTVPFIEYHIASHDQWRRKMFFDGGAPDPFLRTQNLFSSTQHAMNFFGRFSF